METPEQEAGRGDTLPSERRGGLTLGAQMLLCVELMGDVLTHLLLVHQGGGASKPSLFFSMGGHGGRGRG